jgi:geranylgeranyl pyrophosphate synthase
MMCHMSGFLWGDEVLDRELNAVRAFLAEEARKAEDFVGRDIARMISREGKLLRPALVLLSARLGDTEDIDLVPIAASVEMIHLATLIHDDIIDGAISRRGAPALHIHAGGAKAVLAGDWLLARALSIAGSHHSPDLFSFLTARIEELCRAEILQDASCGDLAVAREDYMHRIDGKTAALLRLACRAGADSTGADTKVLDSVDNWALSVGRAFQMDDDALDYEGRPGHMGKGISVDLRAGLATLPLIIACESGDPAILKLIRKCSVPGPIRRYRIRKTVIALGSVEAARNEARAAYASARKLAALLPGSGPEGFGAILDRLEGRAR